MNVNERFINRQVLSEVSTDILKRLSNDDRFRVLRGYKGNPSFVFDTEDRIVAELRPTETSNYVLYTVDEGTLKPDKKLGNLEDGLRSFMSVVENHN